MNAIELYNEGLMKARAGVFDEAIELLERSIEKDPSHVNTYNVLGKVLIQKGALRKARKSWERSLAIDPLNRTALACLEASRRGKRLSRVGWPTALVLALIGAVFAFRATNDRIGKLRNDLSALFSLLNERSSYSAAKGTRGQGDKGTRGQGDKETKPGEGGVAVTPSPPLPLSPSGGRGERGIKDIYETAMGYYKEGKFDDAIPKFEEILRYPLPHPLKDNAQYWIGECYYDKGDYQRALNEFEKVKSLYPDGNKVLHAQIKVAYCHYKLGEDEKALDLLMRLVRGDLKDPYADRVIREMIRRIRSKLKDGDQPHIIK